MLIFSMNFYNRLIPQQSEVNLLSRIVLNALTTNNYRTLKYMYDRRLAACRHTDLLVVSITQDEICEGGGIKSLPYSDRL